MSQFFIGSASQSAESTPAYTDSPAYASDDEDTLPYPAELSRNDFLAPDFDPQTYLSSLRNRHQTLEDLRSDLRQRSQLLNRELLDLVNGNYEEFLSLGGDLKGGEEKVEGVRVGLLGFQREVEGIRKVVQERATETGELLKEKKSLRREVVLGRQLLELNEKLEELEETMGITAREGPEDEDETLDDEDEDTLMGTNGATPSPIKRLRQQATEYLVAIRTSERIGLSHPFLVDLRPRLDEVRKTILLDLSTALRQARTSGDQANILSLSSIFGELDAQKDALKVLKGS